MKRRGKGKPLGLAPHHSPTVDILKEFQGELKDLGSMHVDAQMNLRTSKNPTRKQLTKLRDNVRTAKVDYLKVQIEMLKFVIKNKELLLLTRFSLMDNVYTALRRCEQQHDILLNPAPKSFNPKTLKFRKK